MCGRYTLRKGFKSLGESVGDYLLENKVEALGESVPRYNIAPTQNNTVFLPSQNNSKILNTSRMRWGLVPSWSKEPRSQSPMINARSETVFDKPSFRSAFERRRCLVPADGFYEWKRRNGINQPYHFTLRDEAPFCMAGIWESWTGKDGYEIQSYTILTTRANSLMAKFHDRMPVILSAERCRDWLELNTSSINKIKASEIFAPFDSQAMAYKVANPVVNNNSNEGPACLEAPTAADQPQLDLDL